MDAVQVNSPLAVLTKESLYVRFLVGDELGGPPVK
jgi:hypothetical protein